MQRGQRRARPCWEWGANKIYWIEMKLHKKDWAYGRLDWEGNPGPKAESRSPKTAVPDVERSCLLCYNESISVNYYRS